VPLRGLRDLALQRGQLLVDRLQVDFVLSLGRADIPGDVEVIAILLDFGHWHPACVTTLLAAKLVGVDNFVDIFGPQAILPLSLRKRLANPILPNSP